MGTSIIDRIMNAFFGAFGAFIAVIATLPDAWAEFLHAIGL